MWMPFAEDQMRWKSGEEGKYVLIFYYLVLI